MQMDNFYFYKKNSLACAAAEIQEHSGFDSSQLGPGNLKARVTTDESREGKMPGAERMPTEEYWEILEGEATCPSYIKPTHQKTGSGESLTDLRRGDDPAVHRELL